MKSEWIIDVLVDLINYAKSHEMHALAQQLEVAAIEAVTEITSQPETVLGANASSEVDHQQPKQ